jgi:hypothetical protein
LSLDRASRILISARFRVARGDKRDQGEGNQNSGPFPRNPPYGRRNR